MGRSKSSGGIGGIVLIGVIALIAVKDPSAFHNLGKLHPPAAFAAGSPSVPGGTYNCRQLEQLWESQGGSSAAAFTAAEIAQAESTGIASETSSNTNGTTDRGLWQINSIWGSLSTTDPAANARAAIRISGNGNNWGPWTTYQTGAYIGRC